MFLFFTMQVETKNFYFDIIFSTFFSFKFETIEIINGQKGSGDYN